MFSLEAYDRGPFLSMFRSDFIGGVACVNRLLNHAARLRVRELTARRRQRGDPMGVDDGLDLAISGEPRRYVGVNDVWGWYRGMGTGPYPCMSALLALEFVCDEQLGSGADPTDLVPILLRECENLAMPALIVGILVRHLELAGDALDPFLAEPGGLEFGVRPRDG